METGWRVLVADDEPYLVRILTFLLAKQGHDVRSADDGDAALRLALEFRPDLIILDVMMPNTDGYEVCRRVRAAPELARCYIVLLSARGQAADRETGILAGADEYITKPFASAEFMAHIRELFEQRSAQRAHARKAGDQAA